MTVLAAIDVGDFLLYHILLPFLDTLAIALLLGYLIKAVRPPLARAWARSPLRKGFLALSKATACLVIAVVGNLLVMFLCWPLMRVPPGSGVKPMALPVLFLLINAGIVGLCGKVAKQTERPDGSILLQVVVAVLCLTPFVGGAILMNLIAVFRGLTFG